MSAIMKEWQLEQDRRLMQFNTYEDYLDSLVADHDLLYLRGAEPRVLAQLGYRSVKSHHVGAREKKRTLPGAVGFEPAYSPLGTARIPLLPGLHEAAAS